MPPLKSGPLVTFVIFAYNQEEYIRVAVEGAFAQTYEPLEIILSDDSSTDHTFEIMVEMAARYTGPHRVVVRKNLSNLGLINHVNVVLNEAASEIVIFAAGDDASFSCRTDFIVSYFLRDSNIMLVHSAVNVIDNSGCEIGFHEPPIKDEKPDLSVLARSESIYIGATGAIRNCCHSVFGPIAETETYEDLIYGFRAALIGRIAYINKPLVKYRSNVGISTQFDRWTGSWLQGRVGYLAHRTATLKQRARDIYCLSGRFQDLVVPILLRELGVAKARLDLHKNPLAFLGYFFSQRYRFALKAIACECHALLSRFVNRVLRFLSALKF